MTYKIAVVEDNPDNRMLVQALLEDTYEIYEYEGRPRIGHGG
jgi:CheY-like chemotaxis protein